MADDGGLSRLQQRLEAIPRDVKKAVEPTLMKQAGNIVDTMERLVPDDPATNAPDLKSSIAITGPGQRTPAYSQPGGSMTVPENAVAITVGDADVRYPRLQEYGTTFHPAQPFFWPSFRLHRKKATSAIKSAVRRAVKKNWGIVMSAPLALQKALRARLTTTPAVTTLVPAASILDRNARPAPDPSIIIGEDQEVDEGRIARNVTRVYSTLHIWKRESGLTGVKAIAAAIKAALKPGVAAQPGFHIGDCYVSSARFLRDPDGETAHGVVTVEALMSEVAS